MKSTIDHAGRLVIPKTIREKAGIRAGSEVELRYSDGVIEIAPIGAQGRIVREGSLLVWQTAGGRPPVTQDAVNDAIQQIRREREEAVVENRS